MARNGKEPNLFQRGAKGIWWARLYLDGREQKKSLRTRNRADARAALEQWKKDLDHARAYGTHRMMWEDAVIHYAQQIMPEAVKPHTAKRYQVSFRQIGPHLAGLYMDRIGLRDMARLVSARKTEGATNATIRRDLTAASLVFKAAAGLQACEGNPALAYATGQVKERRRKLRLPTDDEIAAAFGKAESASFGRLLRIALQTGMRENEILTLEWRQIDLTRAIEIEESKTDRPRSIPLTDRLISPATGTISGTPKHAKTSLVFWHGDGQPYRNFASQFAAWKARNGVRFRFHDLRHKFAVEYLRAGGHIYDLQLIMGHASIKTTEGYLAHLTPEERRKATGPKTGTSVTVSVVESRSVPSADEAPSD